MITNTFSVGAAHQGIYEYAIKSLGAQEGKVSWFMLPVVCETFDGYLNDVAKFAVKPEHIVRGLERATSERVREGNVGGGTGMICHLFKGGTGSSSRLVPGFDSRGGRRTFTIGALVQANYGKKQDFRIVGVPVGRILAENAIEEANDDSAKKAAQEEQWLVCLPPGAIPKGDWGLCRINDY